MEYDATVWDPYQNYNNDKFESVQHGRAARFVKSRYTRYSSGSDMLDELGWPLLSQGDRMLDLFCFTKLLTVWLKCPSNASLLRRIRVLDENTIRNVDRLVIQLASMDSRFLLKLLVHGPGLLSLNLRLWIYLDKIFFKISVHSIRIIP